MQHIAFLTPFVFFLSPLPFFYIFFLDWLFFMFGVCASIREKGTDFVSPEEISPY